MRIPNCCRAEFQGSSIDFQGFPDHLAFFTFYWNRRTVEADPAHFHLNLGTSLQDPGLNPSSQGLDGKRLFTDLIMIPQTADENSEAVAAFFRFAAVGVEDSEPNSASAIFLHQDPIGTQPQVSVADADDGIRIRFNGPVRSLFSKEFIPEDSGNRYPGRGISGTAWIGLTKWLLSDPLQGFIRQVGFFEELSVAQTHTDTVED